MDDVEPCCNLHVEGRTGVCCDPDDCGPCCPGCPTCPTLHRIHPNMARSEDRVRPVKR